MEWFKVKFWEKLEGLFHNIQEGENNFLKVDQNGHVRSISRGFEGVHRGRGYGLKDVNEDAKSFQKNLSTFDFAIVSKFFRKKDGNLIKYKSGMIYSQKDLFLIRKSYGKLCIDFIVILEDIMTTNMESYLKT